MPSTTRVREFMTSDVASLRPDQTIAEAADALAAYRFGAMPVTDEHGVLLGMLTDDDLILTESRVHVPTAIVFLGATFTLPGEQKRFEQDMRAHMASTVADVMDTDPPTVGPDATLEDVATLMHDRDVTHVPVVDAERRLVGVVARGDLVRFIARTT